MDLENFPTSESAKRMMDTISKGFYENSYVGKWIFQVMGLEIDDTRARVDELPYQAFLQTVTWGMRYYEEKYGLEVDEIMSLEERRKRVQEKISNRGSINPEIIKAIAENITGRECDVKEFAGDYTFWITVFQGEEGFSFKEFLERIDNRKQSHFSYGVTLDLREKATIAYACVIKERKKIRDSGYTGGNPLEDVTWYVDENEIILMDENRNILVE